MKKHSFDDIMFHGFLCVLWACLVVLLGMFAFYATTTMMLVVAVAVGVPTLMYLAGKAFLIVRDFIRDRK